MFVWKVAPKRFPHMGHRAQFIRRRRHVPSFNDVAEISEDAEIRIMAAEEDRQEEMAYFVKQESNTPSPERELACEDPVSVTSNEDDMSDKDDEAEVFQDEDLDFRWNHSGEGDLFEPERKKRRTSTMSIGEMSFLSSSGWDLSDQKPRCMVSFYRDKNLQLKKIVDIKPENPPTLIEVAKDLCNEVNPDRKERIVAAFLKLDRCFNEFVHLKSNEKIIPGAKYQVLYENSDEKLSCFSHRIEVRKAAPKSTSKFKACIIM
ncbi:hypothetical protein L596_028438 [Steinernema carpocapsae]|uniref:Uncharacterized protein n=1 Tax=Steinernema carpocapsae TaxID=34508 RepID=A0A4U5LYI4_STECR|nr:hypothetical protein L596_028438 [Steinernema carpocapsae]